MNTLIRSSVFSDWLCAGHKSSQRRDIANAKRMARELKESGR